VKSRYHAVRQAITYSATWLLLSWSLLLSAIWLRVHGQEVRLVRTELVGNMACAVVRQPKRLWVLLDSTRADEARTELYRLLATWPADQIGERFPGVLCPTVAPASSRHDSLDLAA
jgi:hypothetical protein